MVPITGLEFVSIKVIVIVDVEDPSARTDPVPVIDELAAVATPATKDTVPPLSLMGVAIESVFVSALVEVIVQVETPEALVGEQAA